MKQSFKFGFPTTKFTTQLIHNMEQETTFYQELQNRPGLDLRDKRGKRLDLALALLGAIPGMLRKRDGALSSVHRSMENNQVRLCPSLGIDNGKVISRAHLPRILMKVNRPAFEELLSRYCGAALDDGQKQWSAGDGKELRGSIEKGGKRGEVRRAWGQGGSWTGLL